MRFSLIHVIAIPDVDIGRRLFGLTDLDDKAVGKVLFHRRKEEAGEQIDIRLVQKRIAAAGLIQSSPGRLSITVLDGVSIGESQLVQRLFDAAAGSDRLITWDGSESDLPLLHYRALRHQVAGQDYWQRSQGQADFHVELKALLAGQRPESWTSLDELSRIVGLPGLLGTEAFDPWETWLAGRRELLLQRAEIAVLNLYLLTLRALAMTGGLSQIDAARGEVALREQMQTASAPHLQRFLELWSAGAI
jgi:predicted PolB exonuclease-like 3'-5' exonuclease